MRWFRGGNWYPLTRADGSLVLATASDFTDYEIRSFTEVDNVLDRLDRFWRSNNLIARGLAARAGESRDSLPHELCRLFEQIGPLRQPGVEPYTTELGHHRARRTLEVDQAAHDVELLATTWETISSRPTGRERERLADTLSFQGLPVLQQEMALAARFRGESFGYDIAPATLRALLWDRILRVFDRNLRAVCPYCGEAFEPERTSGRAYRYCPPHRTSACREAVRKNRAPASRFTGRFDLTLGGIENG